MNYANKRFYWLVPHLEASSNYCLVSSSFRSKKVINFLGMVKAKKIKLICIYADSSMSTHLDYPGYRPNFPFPHMVLQYGYNMNDEAYKYSFQTIK